MKNTIAALEKNQMSHYDGTIGEREEQLAQTMEFLIERSRSLMGPRPGDLLVTEKDEAHIESVNEGGITICHDYYIPFVSGKIDSWGHASVSMNTSGGPWEAIPVQKFERIREQNRRFQIFCGMPRANGTIELLATVNVWKKI